MKTLMVKIVPINILKRMSNIIYIKPVKGFGCLLQEFPNVFDTLNESSKSSYLLAIFFNENCELLISGTTVRCDCPVFCKKEGFISLILTLACGGAL